MFLSHTNRPLVATVSIRTPKPFTHIVDSPSEGCSKNCNVPACDSVAWHYIAFDNGLDMICPICELAFGSELTNLSRTPVYPFFISSCNNHLGVGVMDEGGFYANFKKYIIPSISFEYITHDRFDHRKFVGYQSTHTTQVHNMCISVSRHV